MRFPLRNGVAVVTGAASGIGAALAGALSARGCHLALADRNAEGLSATAAHARSAGVKVSEHVFDIADNAAIAALPEAVLSHHGRATILINNAGVALEGSFDEVSLDEFAWLMDINFWGVVRMMKAFLPLLREQPAAQIVNISSVFGMMGLPGQCAYSASKFAVRGVSEVLRHELEQEESTVRLSVVHPGGVNTNIARTARVAAAAKPKTEEEEAADRERMERLLSLPPEEAAAQIIRGLTARRRRILVGRDARQIDFMQRFAPENYWPLIRRKVQAR